MGDLMKSIGKVSILCISIYVLMLSIKPAYAYLDPGTGSMMVQAVLAVIAAVSVSVGIFWNRIKMFFGRIFGEKKRDQQDLNK